MIEKYNCYKCKKRKTAEHFYKDRTRFNGLMSKCIDCTKVFNAKRIKKLSKEIYSRRKDYYLEYQKRYYAENQIKVKAKRMVMKALKSGEIKKGVCNVCGSKKVTGHHPDYSKPLKIVWLCQKHHQREHNRLKLLNKTLSPKENKNNERN